MATEKPPGHYIVAGVDCREYVKQVVAEAPPLSPEEIEHLRFLLRAPVPQRRTSAA